MRIRGSKSIAVSDYHFDKLSKFVFLDKRFAKDNDMISPNRKKIVEDAIDMFYALLSDREDPIITKYNTRIKRMVKEVLIDKFPDLKEYLKNHKRKIDLNDKKRE